MEENRTLKRNIKRTKMILDEKMLNKPSQKPKDRRPSLDRRDSDNDSSSFGMSDRHSLSALGGGVQKLDLKKIEQFNHNVTQMILAKNPFDAMQLILKTFKQYFKNVARCTIFIMNSYLQEACFPSKTGFDPRRRNCKEIKL